MNWSNFANHALHGKRIVWVSDGTYNYFTELPADVSLETATDEFVRNYEFPDDTDDHEAARRDLRGNIQAGIIDRYDSGRHIADQK